MHGDKLALDREWFIVCIACSAFSCDYYSWTIAAYNLAMSLFLEINDLREIAKSSATCPPFC